MSSFSKAEHGWWMHQDQPIWNRIQYLTSTKYSNVAQSFLAVIITLTWIYTYPILIRIYQWIEFACIRARQKITGGYIRLQHDADDTLVLNQGGRESSWNLVTYSKNIIRGEEELNPTRFKLMLIATIILFTGFLAHTLASIFSSKISVDPTARFSSKNCGIWALDDNAGDKDYDLDDLYLEQKELRASNYARNCYSIPNVMNPSGYDFFSNQSIGFSTKSQQLCPFDLPEMCTGLYEAVNFDTGLIDASVIGINAGQKYKFRRQTTCSPLNMASSYIKEEKASAATSDRAFQYFYGDTDDSQYTFNTSGDPFNWHVPVYSVNTYFSSLYPEDDYWRPIPGLSSEINNTLTIMFISSTHILHVAPISDPIFGATTKYRDSESLSGEPPLYYNSDPRARPMACIDKSEICTHDGKHCWSLKGEGPQSKVFTLMKLSLASSTIYDSIKSRLGVALLAQESIGQYVSGPLSPRQWEIEASALFATSLARIQYDALGIAIGEDRERPGYIDYTPKWARGKLCKMVLFKTGADYTNVNMLAYFGIILANGLIWVLSWERKSEDLILEGVTLGKKLYFDVVILSLGYCIYMVGYGIYAFKGWLVDAVVSR